MAGTGWDAAAHRRECTIPPDQLKALNALPGWERTFQAAPLDETPDDSPASSQQGALPKRLSLVPEKTKSAQVKVAAPSPGAHARRQRAPVLSFDDEDEEEEEEENARKRADALVRAGRGDANPEMADPQTFGLRGVASAPPRAEHFATDDALRLDASLLPAMERQGLAMAFSPARTRGRAAKAERVSQRRAEAETDALEDIMPTQAADPEAQRDAARGAAAALATLFSPVGTRASRRRKLQAPGETKAEGYEMADSRIEEEAIAPTQAEPEPERRKTRGVLAAALDAVRGAVGLRAGASDPEPPSSSRHVSALPETSGGEPGTEPDVRRAGSPPVAEKAIRSPFAGRHRRRRLDDAREDARWDSFARLVDKSLVDASPPITQKTAEPTMAPSAAAAVVDAVAAAAADGPTSPRRATSAFGDQGGDAPDFRGTHNERDARVALGRVSSPGGGARVDLASSLVASRFSTGKKRKRSGIGSGPSGRAPPAPTASPASRVVPVAEAARAASPGLLTAEPASAAPEQRSVSPADALLAARFSGKKRRRNREKAVAERSSGGLGEPAAPLRGVDALVDVDGDGTGTGTDGAPWYAGGTAEKPEKAEKVSSKKQERVTRAKAGVNKRAGAPESKRRDARDPAPARSTRTRRGASNRAEEEFAAVLADLADATETRADADAKREAAAAKSAVARPPSSVARAISFEETWEGREKDSFSREKEKEKEKPADALALFGGVVPRFRGKRQVSASTPRRTPAVGVPAPKTKARDPRRSAMSLLRLGD